MDDGGHIYVWMNGFKGAKNEGESMLLCVLYELDWVFNTFKEGIFNRRPADHIRPRKNL